VRAIRERVASDKQSVATLEAQVPDPGFRECLQVIRHWLEEIEPFFLASLPKESRTPEQEPYWVRQAEVSINLFIAPQLKIVQDAFAKFGSKVTFVG
jgi:hypothetical protein